LYQSLSNLHYINKFQFHHQVISFIVNIIYFDFMDIYNLLFWIIFIKFRYHFINGTSFISFILLYQYFLIVLPRRGFNLNNLFKYGKENLFIIIFLGIVIINF
jgi:hypothetical protein